MNIMLNATSELRGSFSRKRSFRQDGSYRIFRITRRCPDDSDDEDTPNQQTHTIIDLEKMLQMDGARTPSLSSSHNGSKRWRRRSTKNRRLLFLSKTSCESTSSESKASSFSRQVSQSIIQTINNNDTTSKGLFSSNKPHHKESMFSELSQSGALMEDMNEAFAHDENTLSDLLARADQLQVTLQQKEFNKMQPISRASAQRKRKRRLITCSIILTLLVIIITIIVLTLTLTIRHMLQVKQKSKSSSTFHQQDGV